jgi:hypothetical protein
VISTSAARRPLVAKSEIGESPRGRYWQDLSRGGLARGASMRSTGLKDEALLTVMTVGASTRLQIACLSADGNSSLHERIYGDARPILVAVINRASRHS